MHHRIVVVTAVVATALAAVVLSQPAVSVARARIAVVTPRPWQVVQRGADGRADLVVRGRCMGVRGEVAVSCGGRRATVRCDRDGDFRARLTRVRAGQFTLIARSVLRPRVVCRRRLIGIGDVYVVAGQSNASGRSPFTFSYSSPTLRASMFGNDDRWKELRDPVDSNAGQVDAISADRHARGSVWPVVATFLLAEEHVPVAFVPCARGSTSIAVWDPASKADRPAGTCYASMARRIAAVGGKVRAVLWWQGERDARRRTPGPEYKAALQGLSDRLWRDFRTPLLVAQIGDYDERYTAQGINTVRRAQAEAWGTSHILSGPVLYDIDLHGNVHFTRPADVKLAARRWAAAVLREVLGRTAVAASPRLVDAELIGRELLLTADGELAPSVLPHGFTVRADGRKCAVEAAAVEAAGGVVRLTLGAQPTGEVRVSLGEGRSGAGASVPVEPSAWRLPMEPFADRPVRCPGS
ncbi:MAG: sialate O-acetylesterase [Actinobacteria bacterium]|nr:sialate O-acetylesterase [Actinomycetota bacterium]